MRSAAKAKARPSIIEFMEDPRLFGDTFIGPSWSPWKIILRAAYGLPLSKSEKRWFCTHTGRTRYAPPPGGWAEVVVIVGRQSGKTRVAALVADYEAGFPIKMPDVGYYFATLVAQDQRNALRTALEYARDPFLTSPPLKAEVSGDVADVLTLRTRVKLAAYPCRPAAVRGPRNVVAICDELAFFQSTEGNPTDTEMLRALRPTLATTGGKLWVLSSPYAEFGQVYELHRKNFGNDDGLVLVVQATAPELNPTLSKDYLKRMEQDDPEAYRSEVLGEFRKGLSTLLDPDALAACVDQVTRERLAEDSVKYYGFVDAATGGGRDRFTAGIAHAQTIGGREIAVLDVVRGVAPPFDPNAAIAEAAALFHRYRIKHVVGDQFAGGKDHGFVQSGFRALGIKYEVSELTRSDLYLEFLPLVNSNTVLLLNHPDMLREFRGLERRRGSSGKDRVDHRPNAHDDLANAAAGALVHVAQARRKRSVTPWTLSETKSTDGSVYINGQLVQGPHRIRPEDAPWVRPHERGEPFWRRAWGGA
jgi:hypothetical protein